MRDPNRIKPCLETIENIWNKYPDQRFGQLMLNLLSDAYNETDIDPFYLEDDKMFEVLKKVHKIED